MNKIRVGSLIKIGPYHSVHVGQSSHPVRLYKTLEDLKYGNFSNYEIVWFKINVDEIIALVTNVSKDVGMTPYILAKDGNMLQPYPQFIQILIGSRTAWIDSIEINEVLS